jgi:hypothetical protein
MFRLDVRAPPGVGGTSKILETIDWSKRNGHAPLVARVRHLNDKEKPDHCGQHEGHFGEPDSRFI